MRPGGLGGALTGCPGCLGCFGCRLHPTPGHRVVQRLVVGLVLVGVTLGEGSDRPVEGVATAEVGRDRDPVARPCVGAGERPAAEATVGRQPRREQQRDVDCSLAIGRLAYVVVALTACMSF